MWLKIYQQNILEGGLLVKHKLTTTFLLYILNTLRQCVLIFLRMSKIWSALREILISKIFFFFFKLVKNIFCFQNIFLEKFIFKFSTSDDFVLSRISLKNFILTLKNVAGLCT